MTKRNPQSITKAIQAAVNTGVRLLADGYAPNSSAHLHASPFPVPSLPHAASHAISTAFSHVAAVR